MNIALSILFTVGIAVLLFNRGAHSADTFLRTAMTLSKEHRANIEAAIKETEYKYFGDYEFSEGQHAAVDLLVSVAQAVLDDDAQSASIADTARDTAKAALDKWMTNREFDPNTYLDDIVDVVLGAAPSMRHTEREEAMRHHFGDGTVEEQAAFRCGWDVHRQSIADTATHKLVPIEPTLEMQYAAIDTGCCTRPTDAYAAMLAAAPQVDRQNLRGEEGMKPNIWLDNGRWHVYADGHQIIGFILRESAYSYAKAIWRRNAII